MVLGRIDRANHRVRGLLPLVQEGAVDEALRGARGIRGWEGPRSSDGICGKIFDGTLRVHTEDGWMDGGKGCTRIAATLMTDDVGEVQTWEEKQIVGRGGVRMYSREWRWM